MTVTVVEQSSTGAGRGPVRRVRASASLVAVDALGLLDGPPLRWADDLVSLAATICATPMAAIALLDEDRQWFLARVGIPIAVE